jgi:ubiquinone/menaquinone biosynthesis C-methylase UbiE
MTCHYTGTELEVFAHAENWKKYFSSVIRPYLGGRVLEVGAGLGTNTRFLRSQAVSSWTCLEPDPALFSRARLMTGQNADCDIILGTTETLSSDLSFDVILYIDVLEHIKNDREELRRASKFLSSGGRIVVLAPAHQWLYTTFDRAIGHYRRYQRSTLLACSPEDCRIRKLIYLDSVGMLASIGNRFLLREEQPQLRHILLWDRLLVPASRLMDGLTLNTVGKSILGIWEKT